MEQILVQNRRKKAGLLLLVRSGVLWAAPLDAVQSLGFLLEGGDVEDVEVADHLLLGDGLDLSLEIEIDGVEFLIGVLNLVDNLTKS